MNLRCSSCINYQGSSSRLFVLTVYIKIFPSPLKKKIFPSLQVPSTSRILISLSR